MPKIKYQDFNFKPASLAMIQRANVIIAEFKAQGFNLTLRQLYYQFVTHQWLANSNKSYKQLGSLINDARLAGLIDWLDIVDRTRGVRSLPHWNDPSDILQSAAKTFNLDGWDTQKVRPEIWIEKDALVGVFEGVCRRFDVPLLSCRGYTSQSEMWGASQRLLRHIKRGQTPYIFHFGDHDPSGRDMSRDIRERLQLFTGGKVNFKRVALNIDQINQYGPPPNPTKVTDSRAEAYIAEFGHTSWELDALSPTVLANLVRDAVLSVADVDELKKQAGRQRQFRKTLGLISENFTKVQKYVEGLEGQP